METNILVVGSGGREHTFSYKLGQSPMAKKIYLATGNGGTSINVPIRVDEIDKLLRFALENKAITVVGPEAPLANGIADEFAKHGLKIFGHNRAATKLESSKVFAKRFMKQNNIPTADFSVFNNPDEAKEYVKGLKYQVVVKADGLAAGKGVTVCDTTEEAINAIDQMMVKKVFGSAGSTIVIERRLFGEELSYIVMTDGKTFRPLATSQDHKKLFDEDKGPNTGGMGAYSPTFLTAQMEQLIQQEIVERTLEGMRKGALAANGFMYFGLMLVKEGDTVKIYLLEINMRSGDPETQSILPRMKSDMLPYVIASVNGDLQNMPPIEWDSRSSATVVMASKDYPFNPKKGEEITGLDLVNKELLVFHSGTKLVNGKVITDGGRVLAVTALGNSLLDALIKAYQGVDQIHWPSEYHRNDIGDKGLDTLNLMRKE